VTAILPNGRHSRMRITPATALIREVNRLRSAHAVAIGKNSRAIAAVAAAYAAAVRKLSAEQVKSDKDLRKRLVEADDRLHQRITKELGGGSVVFDKNGQAVRARLARGSGDLEQGTTPGFMHRSLLAQNPRDVMPAHGITGARQWPRAKARCSAGPSETTPDARNRRLS
jgi:hypothetical protein